PLGVGLDAPGDLADQVGPVTGPAGPAVQLGVALGQLARGHLLQGVNLGFDVGGHVAPFVEVYRDATRSPAGHGATLSLVFAGRSRRSGEHAAGFSPTSGTTAFAGQTRRSRPRARMLATSCWRSSVVIVSGSRVVITAVLLGGGLRESARLPWLPMPCAR